MKPKISCILATLLVCVLRTVSMAGCIGTPSNNTPTEINVFATASLTGVMTELGNKFTEKNPNIKVNFNFAGSQTLKTQILEGVDADVFISANMKLFTPVADAGLITGKKILLKNKLAIAVPKTNTAGITDLAGMVNPGVVLVIGNKDVPFGQYTRHIITKYQNDSHAGYVDAFMANVKSTVDAVDKIKPLFILDEADASLVYKSDISKSDKNDVTLIEIPDAYNVIADYPWGVLAATKNTDAVKSFEAYLTGPVGTALLTDYGFDPVAA